MGPKRTVVINLFAGPGAGKSKLAARLFSELGFAAHMFGDVEHVPEFAKRLVWEKRFDDLANQPFVTKNQLALQMPMIGEVDFVVTDSPIELGLVYAKDEYYGEVRDLIMDARVQYDTVNIFLERGSIPYRQNGRVESPEKAKEKDDEVKAMLRREGIEYHTVHNCYDVSSVIAHMVDAVKNGAPVFEIDRACAIQPGGSRAMNL